MQVVSNGKVEVLIDISAATVGITLFIYALKLWEFFDLEYEKAYEHLTTIKKCLEIHENDQVLLDARKAHKIILANFDGSRRFLWMWFPGFLLLLLFFLVTFLPSLALTELASGLELWVVIYFVAVFIPVFGAMYGARGRPIVKYRRARNKFPSCFKEYKSDPSHNTKNESLSEHVVIKNMNTPKTSELLLLRSDLRADIRSLDDLNFKIISIIGTVSFAIMTAGTALGEMDYVVFFFAGIAIVNYMAAVMLLKNRISVLEKTWYVCYLESRLPEEYRRFWPFGFKHFDEPLPKGRRLSQYDFGTSDVNHLGLLLGTSVYPYVLFTALCICKCHSVYI